MRIIALQGQGNTGKTTTLKLLIEKILSNGHKLIAPNLSELTTMLKGKGDAWAVFTVENKQVGITTRGDFEQAIICDFGQIMKYGNCDVFVCAIRTSGGTVNCIKGLSGNWDIYRKLTFASSNTAMVSREQAKQNNCQVEYLYSILQNLSGLHI